MLAIAVAAGALVTAAAASGAGPSGPWGSLIGCLQSHPTLSVSTAGTGGAITPATNSVSVWSQAGHPVAYLGNISRGSDGFTGSGDTSVNTWAGPVAYGFAPQADAAERSIVSACIRSSRIAHDGCPTVSLGDGATCALAAAVISTYYKDGPGTKRFHGLPVTTIQVPEPGAKQTLAFKCVTAGKTGVCVEKGTKLAVGFPMHRN